MNISSMSLDNSDDDSGLTVLIYGDGFLLLIGCIIFMVFIITNSLFRSTHAPHLINFLVPYLQQIEI